MTNFRKWSQTATGNASIAGGATTINWAEGQPAASVNNSMRESMAQLRQKYRPDRWGWVEFSATASVASQTTFKIVGDQTADYTANRRVKLASGSSARYGTIVSSSFTTETTVTITVDSGSLSASHTLVAVSTIDANHVPSNIYTSSASVSSMIAAALVPYLTSDSLSTGYATAAEIRAGTAVKGIAVANMVAALDELSVTYSATVTLDFALAYNFGVTLTGNCFLIPKNHAGLVGRSGFVRFTQDGTGSRLLDQTTSPFVNVNSQDVVLSTAASAKDFVTYSILPGPLVLLSLARAVG